MRTVKWSWRAWGVSSHHHVSVQTSLQECIHTTMHPHIAHMEREFIPPCTHINPTWGVSSHHHVPTRTPHGGWVHTTMHPDRFHFKVTSHQCASVQNLLWGSVHHETPIRTPDDSPQSEPYCELSVGCMEVKAGSLLVREAVQVGRKGLGEFANFPYAGSDPKAVLKINYTENRNLWAWWLSQGLEPQQTFCAGPFSVSQVTHIRASQIYVSIRLE